MKKKILKLFLIVILGAITISGSLNFEKGVWPFYTQKSGNSFGINFCLMTKYPPGSSHTGIDISFITIQNENSKINGINISFGNFDEHSSVENTISFNPKDSDLAKVNGIEIGLVNAYGGGNERIGVPRISTKRINGAQIGLFNESNLNGIQFGVYNEHCKLGGKKQRTIGLNIGRGDN